MKLFSNISKGSAVLFAFVVLVSSCGLFEPAVVTIDTAGTISDVQGKIGEPFGIAAKDGEVYVSDGAKGIIWKIDSSGTAEVFSKGFETPSHIAFDENGNLLVADSGNHTILKVARDGSATIAAGVRGKSGYRDGPALSALFRAPIGIAAAEGKIYVADSYNDRIRVISDGTVTTFAGGEQGFEDSNKGLSARFDTPTGLALFGDGLLVADTGNRRIRVVERDGRTATLAGGSKGNSDGMLGSAGFRMPVGLAVDRTGLIYVADGDQIRKISAAFIPFVSTIGGGRRGFADGELRKAMFNRPSGLAVSGRSEVLVADSDNGIVRVLTDKENAKILSAQAFRSKRQTAAEFRAAGKPRWPFEAYNVPREIAGTLGEIRGHGGANVKEKRFHNGLDIAGGYGEKAVVVRPEKVLRPLAVSEFGTNRENIRFPGLGYIHLRLGRDAENEPFSDRRFLFRAGKGKKPAGLRVPRGASFEPGDVLGTLNSMNHVHLIAGPSGSEFNALDALRLPGATDNRVPVIEEIRIFDGGWREFDNNSGRVRTDGGSKLRITASAYDQMDGNSERRRLGLYKLGYQLLDDARKPLGGFESIKWTIVFDVTPPEESVGLVYAEGSRSGATGVTVFNYIVSNPVNSAKTAEEFVDTSPYSGRNIIVKVYAADYFGNTVSKEVLLEVGKRKS